jgi:magnesium transporter
LILIHRPARGPSGAPDALDRHVLQAGEPIPDDTLWVDLVEPTREEDRIVERFLSIEIPTREEMADIEPSEILYHENNARYMTARVLCHSETETPKLVDVSFILTERALVTVRYDEPRSFSMFMTRAVKPGGCRHQPEAVLDGLIETIIDRAAEILAIAGKRRRASRPNGARPCATCSRSRSTPRSWPARCSSCSTRRWGSSRSSRTTSSSCSR